MLLSMRREANPVEARLKLSSWILEVARTSCPLRRFTEAAMAVSVAALSAASSRLPSDARGRLLLLQHLLRLHLLLLSDRASMSSRACSNRIAACQQSVVRQAVGRPTSTRAFDTGGLLAGRHDAQAVRIHLESHADPRRSRHHRWMPRSSKRARGPTGDCVRPGPHDKPCHLTVLKVVKSLSARCGMVECAE